VSLTSSKKNEELNDYAVFCKRENLFTDIARRLSPAEEVEKRRRELDSQDMA